jgi:hypothetical protein
MALRARHRNEQARDPSPSRVLNGTCRPELQSAIFKPVIFGYFQTGADTIGTDFLVVQNFSGFSLDQLKFADH